MMPLEAQIELDKLPKHLAIIMDGNGRWAKEKGKLRVFGHEHGAKTVKEIVQSCVALQIPNLTLYAFSTENWNRPKLEVEMLMRLLANALQKEIDTLLKNNIRLCTIGNITDLPKKVGDKLLEVKELTKNNTGLTLTLALSYGSKQEILDAIKQIAFKVKNNIISVEKIDESIINEHLYTQNLPEVDLLIRTSGEQRISNFMLWQIAYAELYFTNTLWPDFNKEQLYKALIAYQSRERRFGKTSEQLN